MRKRSKFIFQGDTKVASALEFSLVTMEGGTPVEDKARFAFEVTAIKTSAVNQYSYGADGAHWGTTAEREPRVESDPKDPRVESDPRVEAGEGRPAHNHPDSYVPPVAPGAAHKCQVGVLYLVNGSRRISDGKAWRCEHNRQPSQCPLCGGIGVCEHGRRRSVCMQCAKEGKRVAVRTAIAANRPFN